MTFRGCYYDARRAQWRARAFNGRGARVHLGWFVDRECASAAYAQYAQSVRHCACECRGARVKEVERK